jgi:hypothetical protein
MEIPMTAKKTASAAPAVREVVSLTAKAKQRRDAMPEPTTYELYGVEFTLQPFKLLPLDAQEKVAGPDDILGILRMTLGDDKVREMIDAGFTLDDAILIGEEWQARSGLEPGESAAS